MKLAERNGRFVSQQERIGIGVAFECPACGERHWVPFANPIDGGECVYPQGGWQRTGETIETLTLTPSIVFYPTQYPIRIVDGKSETLSACPGWHGYITNGELVTV